MLSLTENQIEEIIYSSPWLVDERFLIPNIIGSRGEKGRQINIGRDKSRFIDLLFKDTRDKRPVIIELKRGKILRENIGQILEYRALLLSLDDDQKEKWFSEFEENFYVPKLILIGSEADQETIISANISGIELRLFGNTELSDLGFDSFKLLNIKIEEWKSFRSSGNRSLIEREGWIAEIIEIVEEAIQTMEFELNTISRSPRLSGSKKFYVDYSFPFLNIPIVFEEVEIIGIYEYYDEYTPFSEDYVYIDIPFIYEYDLDDGSSQMAFKRVREFKMLGIEVFENVEYSIPSLKMERKILENKSEFVFLLQKLIDFSIELYNETYPH